MADEGGLREAKVDLLERYTDMERQAGKIPDTRKAEDFVNPIIEKVSRDDGKSVRDPAPAPTAEDKAGLKPGDSYGDKKHAHLTKIPDELPGGIGKTKFLAKTLGEYAFGNAGKNDVRPLDGAPAGQRKMRRGPIGTILGVPVSEEMTRDVVRQLWTDPGYKARLQVILNMNDLRAKAKAYEALLEDAFTKFGTPVRKKDRPRKIVVH